MNRLGITLKLTLIFILFAGILMVALSVPAYLSARAALRSAAIAERLSSAIEKEEALNTWVADRKHAVEDIAGQAPLREAVQVVLTAPPDSLESIQAHDLIQANLLTWAGEGHRFLSFQVIDANTGRVLVSTTLSDEGKFREDDAYFIEGLRGGYVQNPFHDLALGRPSMVAAAPLRVSENRPAIAVLAGLLNMDEMSAILQRRTGLLQTDDAFLVNTSHLLVTQPHLIPDPAVLQRGIQTEAMDLCLARNSGVVEALDYRGVPGIIVYRWLPERQLCLISKIDQGEAYAPSKALGTTMVLIGGLVLLLGSIAAASLSRTIAKPVLQLVQGAEQISQGNLDTRIEVKSGDEIGKLGHEFNKMAGSLAEKEAQLRAWAAELEQKVEQRTAELGASEERYRILSETSPDMIFVIDQQDRVQYVNTRAAKQFGKTPEQVTGKARTELFPPAIAEGQALGLQQVLKSGQPLSSESPIAFPGGQLWLDTQLVPLRNETGAVTAVMGVSRDITDRKLADRILQEEKALSDSIINSLPGIFYLFDTNGKFLRWNRNFERVSGYSAEEMLERNPLDFFSGEEKALVEERIQETFVKGKSLVEANFISRVGTGTPFLLTGVRVEINQQTYLIGTGIDIGERKQAEEELHLKNIAFNASISANSIANVEGIITQVNPAFLKLWGYASKEAAIGNSVGSFFVNEADAISVMEAINKTGQWEGEFLAKRMDGGATFISKGLASAIYDAKGEHIGYQSANLDVTAEKQAEDRLTQTLEDLARSNAELERFAYVASHDLQEPLRMVTSYLQLLERRYKDKLDGDALDFINYAVDGSNRMKTLISDLLAYSRVGTRGKEFVLADCEEVLGNVLSALQISIEESQATVTHDPLPKVMADHAQLESLFQNLIGNAIKFHGGKPPVIHVGVKKEEKNWVFSVKDNGIGIDPQYFERIFIIFQRLHNREDYPGTGIGLAISKRIVERHGGRMWIESQQDKGSTFFFTLPIQGE